ncbi:hypothetical protein GTO27_09890 [Candidatus Bathyarchaeota archaeon]|nr:hypothetical protein [Candidatus Bathyarchaeota archaeon]
MIFLGAGASAPFGIPTSKTLTSDIRILLAEEYQKLLDKIDEFWREIYEKEPNYENILTFLSGLTNPRKIPKESVVQAFIRSNQAFRKDYNGIIDKMYSKIVDYCTAPFVRGEKHLTAEQLEEIFGNTYDIFALFEKDPIFTTNYDPSIEIWCQKRNIQLHDNTGPTHNPEVREVLPIGQAGGQTMLSYRQEKGSPALRIIRLHGSTWVYESKKKKKIKMNRPRDKLLFADLYQNLSKRPHMIFPGQESLLARGEWDALYQTFKSTLQGNCLVIGYSFQDETINRAFINNLDNGRLDKIGIMNSHPEEAVKNLFWDQESIPEQQIIKMPVEFGTTQTADEISNKWFYPLMGISYSGGPRRFLEIFRKNRRAYLE